MGQNTKIQWTDHTFNPWTGCQKVSPGCANCYAEVSPPARISRSKSLPLWGPPATAFRKVASEAMWREPLKWNKTAACQCGGGFRGTHSPYCPQADRPRVFCASLADVFEDWQGPMIDSRGEELGDYENTNPLTMQDVRRRLFALIDDTPNLDWLLLTKRPENIERFAPPMSPAATMGIGKNWIRHNVWLGVSVENQATKPRIDILRTVPASIRFLSIEPLIEDLGTVDLTGIHLVIAGGESGPNARPCNIESLRSLRDQCRAARVKFFLKQLGAKPVQFGKCDCGRYEHGRCHQLCPSIDPQPLSLRDPKGGDITEFPPDLRVREWPEVRADR